MIRIMIVDDHKHVLNSWKTVLESNPAFKVVAECHEGHDALKKAEELKPDIILLDIKMQPLSGFEITSILHKKTPSIKIIGLSVNNHPAYASKLIDAGACGYLTKTSPLEEIKRAITTVNEGKVYICEEVKSKMQASN